LQPKEVNRSRWWGWDGKGGKQDLRTCSRSWTTFFKIFTNVHRVGLKSGSSFSLSLWLSLWRTLPFHFHLWKWHSCSPLQEGEANMNTISWYLPQELRGNNWHVRRHFLSSGFIP
jgi:hypothetical protein